jgi:hypothetical protein
LPDQICVSAADHRRSGFEGIGAGYDALIRSTAEWGVHNDHYWYLPGLRVPHHRLRPLRGLFIVRRIAD